MTDVRLVTVEKYEGQYGGGIATHITDDPNGEHLLVLCGKVHQDAEGWLIRFESDEIVDCQGCGGSGEVKNTESFAVKMPMIECPACNGLGWRLSDE